MDPPTYKHPSSEGEQHAVRNKIKEDFQIMWHKVRLLQMSEREKLPKLKTNSKLIKLQEEINGVIEELLEEDEMDITYINNLIYAAATNMTQTLNEPSKISKTRRNVKFWKTGMQKQISSWRKELSIIAETGTGSDNGKLNKKMGKIFKKYTLTNARDVAQLTETLKQEVQTKAQRIKRYEKRETQYSQNKMFKEDTKIFYRNLGMKNTEAREPPSMAEAETYWKSLWGEEAQHNERAEWVYPHMPKPVYEEGDVTVLWNQAVHTEREVTVNRPDIIIKNKKEKTCTYNH